jgi:hypothetical protein
MTPKEKANDILVNFYKEIKYFEIAKKCALIAVDEILNLCWNGNEVGINFWNEVKQEIQIQKL